MELIGRRFGHIRITDVIGQGGMGDVYAGYDEKLDRKVALKVLHAENRLDAESRERLVREARALSKLEHPNICRIHDYIESADVDVLVLEYIDGRTLQDVIYGEQTSRGEKLRIALAVAEVLVAAHRVGIVHRDLKPENVMLTKHGQVKVLDFGLARWLVQSTSKRMKVSSGSMPALVPKVDQSDNLWFPMAQDSAAAALKYEVVNYDDRPFTKTAAGITMGTPLYMSPEQARGEELTTASDMFAFGLLMQCLFTGGDPHPPGLTAREVLLRAARGEIVPVHGVAGDITTLINHLEAFAPADRPTAIETVRKLRFLTEKPQRVARRSAIAFGILLVVGAAWRYTVDLSRERTIAVTERAEAQKRRAQLEDTLNFMLGDLRDKLGEVGRLDILDAVSERALLYVDSLHPEVMSAGELARNAKALNQLGEVRVRQGKTAEALSLFRRSLRLADEAVKREPKNAEALMVLGATHFWIGDGERLQGNKTDALRHMREYMRVGDTLVSLDATKKEYQLERASGHSTVAVVLEASGELDQAHQHYMTSLAVRRALAQQDPGNAEMQAELARAYNKLAALLFKKGDLRAALDYSRREVDIYRDLLRREPEQMQWKNRLATSIAYLARALTQSGDTASAVPLWQEVLKITSELAARDPSNVEWQRSLAITSRWLGALREEAGDAAGARRLYANAVATMDDAVRKAPGRSRFVIDAANVRAEYARSLVAGGDARGIAMLRQSIEILEPIHEPYARQQLARTLLYLGEATAKSDPRGAAKAVERAEAELAPVAATTRNPEELALWTRILIRRERLADARAVVARLKQTGFSTTQLERLCAESGC